MAMSIVQTKQKEKVIQRIVIKLPRLSFLHPRKRIKRIRSLVVAIHSLQKC